MTQPTANFLRRLLLPCLAALVLTQGTAGAGDLENAQNAGKIVVATFPQPTSHFSRPDGNGEYEGFDIELLTTFAKRIGLQLEFHTVGGYDELIPALLEGKADIVASSFTITEERGRVVDFSAPYFPVLVQVVVPTGSSIRSIDDLQGRRGSAMPGSNQERAMLEMGGIEMHHVASSLEHWEVLRTGAADFALIDSTSVFRDRDKSAGTEVAFNLPGTVNYGCAFRPGSDLKAVFDEHLANLRSTSYIYGLVRRHFGEDGVALYRLASEGN